MATHTLTEAMGTGYFSPTSWSPNAVPGDTIIFAADRVSGILLEDFNGTAANPYIFTNPSDAKVTIATAPTNAIQFYDSDNFILSGDNYASETYGIEIDGGTNDFGGTRFWRCADWIISYLHIHDITAGITQNNNDPWTQSDSMGSCRVHHNLIEDTVATYAEGMYLGKSSSGDHPQWTKLEVDNNKVYRTGSDSIQIGQSASTLIHDNWCEDCGTQNDVGQNFGIILGDEVDGIEVYRNTVIRARKNGIEIGSGAGESSIHDNVVWDAGYGETGNGIKINTTDGISTVINNTVIGATGDGIRTNPADITGEIRYNLLVANVSSGINSQYSTQNDNRTSASIPNEYFVDAATGNFRLTSISPARDAGVGAGYSTTDLDGNTRPYGSTDPDIGAFEYIEAGIPYIRSRGILHRKPRYNMVGGRF